MNIVKYDKLNNELERLENAVISSFGCLPETLTDAEDRLRDWTLNGRVYDHDWNEPDPLDALSNELDMLFGDDEPESVYHAYNDVFDVALDMVCENENQSRANKS